MKNSNSNRDNDRHIPDKLVSYVRRKMGGESLLVFAQTYLSSYFHLPPSSFHEELINILQDISLNRNQRVAVAAPRGYAKSTIVNLAYPLWAICYEREKFIVIISDTIQQAARLLASIKSQLEKNPRLQADFPDVCGAVGTGDGPFPWNQGEIVSRNGIMVCAVGTEQSIRGIRHDEDRPSLIILDDVENQASVISAVQRDKLDDWFKRTVLNLGTPDTNVAVVGTVMHQESLLAMLIDKRQSPTWLGRKFKAVISWPDQLSLWDKWEAIYCCLDLDENGATGSNQACKFFDKHKKAMLVGTEVLWPEREDFYDLMVRRIEVGRASFASEKQNEPVDPEDALFPEEGFVYWDADGREENDLIDSLHGQLRYIGACDPSLGKAGKGHDYSAIVTLLQDTYNGTCYVVDADINRQPPDCIIDNILTYHEQRDYKSFAVETNQFQELFAAELMRKARDQGLRFPIEKITHSSDKIGRIQQLQPLIKAGIVRFSRRHRKLLDQLRQFPNAAHDDGPDALEMALSQAEPCRRWPAQSGGVRTVLLPVVGIYDHDGYGYGGPSHWWHNRF